MNNKNLFAFIFAVFAFLSITEYSNAARKPDITSHDAELLKNAIGFNVEWQSEYPVVLLRISAGNKTKKIKLDEYDDNIKDAHGFHGEASEVIDIGEIGIFDDHVTYIIQIEDELGRKSRRVTGKIKIKGMLDRRREDRESERMVKEYVDTPVTERPVGVIDKVLDVMARHDTPPYLHKIELNRWPEMRISIKAKANDDKGLKKVIIKIIDVNGEIKDEQTFTDLGKIWEGNSKPVQLTLGNYTAIVQAIDTGNNHSKERRKGFSIGEQKPEDTTLDTTPPVTTALPGGKTYDAPQSITLTCADTGGSGCDKTFYTTDGSEPTIASTVYSRLINIAKTTTLKFFSVDKAGNKENVKTESYDIIPPPPSRKEKLEHYKGWANATIHSMVALH